jgi:hypothetical protein
MFVGPEGNLTNKDPRQDELPGIRVVEKSTSVRLEGDDEQPAVRVG